MPRVGDKEFPYTDDGMRQAQIHANRTGQSVNYPENNKRFGYQLGGMANSTGDLGSKARKFLNRGEEMSQDNALKRQFMSEHGKMPYDVEEPASLLEENRMFELAKRLSGSPPSMGGWRGQSRNYMPSPMPTAPPLTERWGGEYRNYMPINQLEEESYMPMNQIEEGLYMPYRGYQEGGMAVPMVTHGGDWMSEEQLKTARIRADEELARHKSKYKEYYDLRDRLNSGERYPEDEPGYYNPETAEISPGIRSRLQKLQREKHRMERQEGIRRMMEIFDDRYPLRRPVN